jgi:hypothetical protein
MSTPVGGGASEPAAGSGEPIPRATEFDAGSDPDRNKVTPTQVCERLATINCAGEAYCCEMPGRTIEACKAALLQTCSNELMLDRIGTNAATGFDAAAAEASYTELERRASECDPTVAAWGGSPEGLRTIFKGTIAAKGECTPTTLTPEAPAAALVSCADAEKYACVYTDPLGVWTCEERSAMGGTCITDNNCIADLYCVTNTVGIPGTCQPRKASGESCALPTECLSLFCKKNVCVDADQQAAYCLEN